MFQEEGPIGNSPVRYLIGHSQLGQESNLHDAVQRITNYSGQPCY